MPDQSSNCPRSDMDRSGLQLPSKKDIELLIAQTDCTEERAIRALVNNNEDLVGAIMELVLDPEQQSASMDLEETGCDNSLQMNFYKIPSITSINDSIFPYALNHLMQKFGKRPREHLEEKIPSPKRQK